MHLVLFLTTLCAWSIRCHRLLYAGTFVLL